MYTFYTSSSSYFNITTLGENYCELVGNIGLPIDKTGVYGGIIGIMENIVFFDTIIQPKEGIDIVSIILIGILVVIIISLLILTFGIISSIKNTTFSLTENEIIIKSFFYGRKIPLGNISVDEIKKIDLDKNTEYSIAMRINGISVPKFKSGWMRLKNGEKALTFITDKNNMVLIPTNKYLLLFSMNNIEEFIDKIKGDSQDKI